jgi:hypothetical protein
MKKALVLGLLVLGLGAAVYAGPLTGSWATTLRFNNAAGLDLLNFESILQVDYAVGGWVLGANAIFNETEFANLYFEADGQLGAFAFTSMLDFDPQTPQSPSFIAWTNAASLSLAGVDVFALFMVQNLGVTGAQIIGSGATLGLVGSAGDIKWTVITAFNMDVNAYYWWAYGYDWMVARDAYQICGAFGTWFKPSPLPWAVQTQGCCVCWSGTSIYVDFPFTCLDVTAYVDFTCTDGFSGMGLWFTGIDTGLDWLTIEEIDIDFTIGAKKVTTYFGLSFGDWGCVRPYFTLDGTGTSITGITLNALALSYSFNGVTFKAGEIFDNTWYSWALNGSVYTWGFTKTGGFSTTSASTGCIYNINYDEFFGVEIDGDSCCGGSFKVGIYNFFDVGAATGIFDWQETLASVSLGIGSNTTLYFGVSYLNTGLNWFDVGLKFVW